VGHYTLGIYRPRTGELHHFDSFQHPVSDNFREFYQRVIDTLLYIPEPDPTDISEPEPYPFRISNIIDRPRYSFNKQTDGVSCGYWMLIYAELVLFRGLNQTFMPSFELNREKKRILTILRSIMNRRLPEYQYPPPSCNRQPTTQQTQSNRNQPQQTGIPNAEPIGEFVPYNATVELGDVPTQIAADDATTEASTANNNDNESQADSQTSQTTNRSVAKKYKEKRKGEKKYASARLVRVPHAPEKAHWHSSCTAILWQTHSEVHNPPSLAGGV
jgi:hypothetical protein